ncbi:MAG: TonB-dependent receptor [Bacteroidales bacterium]|nr:TonB-dependent receptor [Bacteroidales bacterium]HOI31246.1 TonB-dependent receptor [Bacteroidales bacterium]
MKIKAIIIFLIGVMCLTIVTSQAQKLSGTVFEKSENGDQPLPGVNVYWSGTQTGTISDGEGKYKIKRLPHAHSLVFSFVGYASDTIHAPHDGDQYDHIMSGSKTLEEVEVVNRAKTNYVSRLSTVNAQTITSGELQKAACCNLSESFETSASVDVSYSDAVTGAKQIELLGLSGIYTQMMSENIPNLRGLATSFGLGYVPGSWMESIQVSKGASSVLNGYESISGQINVEYKKAETSERFFLNLFQDHMGRSEINFNTKAAVNDHMHAMVMGHWSRNGTRHDDNDDGFLDDPLYTQYNLFARTDFHAKNFEGQFGVKGLKEDRRGGQMRFDPDKPRDVDNGFGIELLTERVETFLKTGFIFTRPQTSLGVQQQFIYHHMDTYFGLQDYEGTQYSYYGNALFQSYISDTRHTYTTGFSYLYDRFDDQLNDSTFNRTESVPGVFYQYTYSDGTKLNLIAGLRLDHHNKFGFFATPRVHLRYGFNEHNILRLSAGKGYRTANVLAENTSMLASSRQLIVREHPKMEEAWNYGLNFSKHIDLNNRELTIGLDIYRTDFINQVILDRDADAHKVLVYNLDGRSYSNSIQLEANYELLKGLDVTVAVRFNDVQMTLNNELQEKPLVNKYKGLVSLSYATNLRKWQFDLTTQFNGVSRLPSTAGNPEPYRLDDYSPAYTLVNAQVTKFFRKWNIYLGGENLTNFKQNNPILAANEPFGPYFDSSIIWGPIYGIKVYAGLRYTIE